MVEQQLFYKRHIFGRHATRVFPVVRSITLMGDLEFVETIDGISIKQRKKERERKKGQAGMNMTWTMFSVRPITKDTFRLDILLIIVLLVRIHLLHWMNRTRGNRLLGCNTLSIERAPTNCRLSIRLQLQRVWQIDGVRLLVRLVWSRTSSCDRLHQMSRSIALRLAQYFRKEDIVMIPLIVHCRKRVDALASWTVITNPRIGKLLLI